MSRICRESREMGLPRAMRSMSDLIVQKKFFCTLWFSIILHSLVRGEKSRSGGVRQILIKSHENQKVDAMTKFTELLQNRWNTNKTLLCVGLDPNPSRFPEKFKNSSTGIFDFCREIVDCTADLVCAFKPQIAYFSSCGAEEDLKRLIDWIHDKHPGIPVILDAKRGDIGSTAEHYAKEAYVRFEADCVTLSPYMGSDSVAPYLKYPEKGAFILCRTSNKGGDDLQMLRTADGDLIYERVAKLVDAWNTTGQLGLVVGATYPKELAAIRALVPELNFLVPGIGAQGGDIEAAVRSGMKADGTGLILNSSRAILYASSEESDFREKARAEAQKTVDAINRARGL
jgi:orotidine-5'-phosphate decarboxylase